MCDRTTACHFSLAGTFPAERDNTAPSSRQRTGQANDAGDDDAMDAEIQQASFDTGACSGCKRMKAVPQ